MRVITPRGEIELHVAVNCHRLFPQIAEPQIRHSANSQEIRKTQLWRCGGIWPVGITPSPPLLLLKERQKREETRYQFVWSSARDGVGRRWIESADFEIYASATHAICSNAWQRSQPWFCSPQNNTFDLENRLR